MKSKLILWTWLFVAIATHAQKKHYDFSLQEAISFALDSSYTSLNANKEVAKALKKKWETTAAGLPQINAQGTYQYFPNIPTSVFELNGQQIVANFGTTYAASGALTLSQLIFDGSYLVGLEAASVFVDYTNTQKEKQDLKVVEGITNAYGGVLLIEESRKVLEENISLLRNNLSELKQLYQVGFTEEENIEQLQITLLQLENQLRSTERLLDISQQMLKLSLGISINDTLVLKDKLEQLTSDSLAINLQDQAFDITKNNDYKLSELLVDQRSLELKLEKAKALPSLAAYAQIGTTANGSESNIFHSTQQQWFFNSVIGANISVPIFSSFKRDARTQQAKISLEQAELMHKEHTDQLLLAYQDVKSKFNYAIDNLATMKQNLALAERIEQKNQIKFKEGIASSFELRQAQMQLYTIQQQYLEAQLEVIKNKASLQSLLNVSN